MTAPSIKEALQDCIAFIRGDISGRAQREGILREAEAALATLQPDGERREAIAQALLARFIERGFARIQGSMFPRGTKINEIVHSYRDDFYADADAVSLASGLVQDEAGGLRAMEQECWTLRCVDIPTGGGDADVGWEVIQHHQAKPYERVIALGKTPKEALIAAIRSARSARDGGAS